MVVLTHLHEDHASAIEAFPEALFIVSATEWEAATTMRFPRLTVITAPHYDFAFEYNTIDFDGDFIESYGPSAGPSTSSATSVGSPTRRVTAPATR